MILRREGTVWIADLRKEGFGRPVIAPADEPEWRAGYMLAQKLGELRAAGVNGHGQTYLPLDAAGGAGQTLAAARGAYLDARTFKSAGNRRYYVSHLGSICDELGARRLAEFEPPDGNRLMIGWTKSMHARPASALSAHTVKTRHSALRVLLTWCKEVHHWIRAVPEFPDPWRDGEKVYEPRDVWIYESQVWQLSDEVLRLCSRTSRWHRRAWMRRLHILCDFYLGQRPEDQRSLAFGHHVSLDFGTWLRRSHKTDEPGDRDETLPIPPPLLEELQIEVDRRGGVQAGELVSGPWPNPAAALHKACDNLGLPRLELGKDLRRSCATHLALKGWPDREIVRWLGHTSSAMVQQVYRKIPRELIEKRTETTWEGRSAKLIKPRTATIHQLSRKLNAKSARLPTDCQNGGTDAT